VSDQDPGEGALDGSFEILGEAAAATEPSKGSLDHPSTRDEHETVCRVRALDDFNSPVAFSGKGLLEFGSGITAVSEDVAQPRIDRADR
jgi:hypothetical protein